MVDRRTVDLVVQDVRGLVGPAVLLDTELVAAAVRGWSHNTRRAFRSDLCLWGDWCRRQRVAPASADAGVVAAWIRALAGMDPSGETVRAMATIERYVVNVGWAYRMAGLDDPTAAPLVRLEKKAARKHLGVRQRQARAIRFKGDIADFDSPASGVCLAHLLKACRRDLLGFRDEALLRTAYDSAGRRSELVAIDVDHIEGPDGQGAGTLFIPTSKTDRQGEGAYAYLAPSTMTAIARWREAGHIDRGALFRRVETHFDGSVAGVGRAALHPNSITLIYKRLIRAAHAKKLLGAMGEAELERWVSAVSSHSIRVGVAQDNFAADESLPAIMQAYRWRDPRTVMRYGAKLAPKSGASARMAKRFSES
ncbi:MAG: integrase [Alphaproteobacteria bacterium HGW-Alphaproteobacteria-16]|nr:MAG: integrase [Alphaproteobacteria bacterium HGW-Alphaproteobacteria-16]